MVLGVADGQGDLEVAEGRGDLGVAVGRGDLEVAVGRVDVFAATAMERLLDEDWRGREGRGEAREGEGREYTREDSSKAGLSCSAGANRFHLSYRTVFLSSLLKRRVVKSNF